MRSSSRGGRRAGWLAPGELPVGVESILELFAPPAGTKRDQTVTYRQAREKLRDLRPGDRPVDLHWRDRTAVRVLRWLRWWGAVSQVGRGRYRLEPGQRAGGHVVALRALVSRMAPAFPPGRTWRYAMIVPVGQSARGGRMRQVGVQFLSTVPTRQLWPALQRPPLEVTDLVGRIRQVLHENSAPELGATLAFQVLAEVIARQPTPCLLVGHPWELLER